MADVVPDLVDEVSEFIGLLDDRNPRVRRFALRRIAELGSPSVIPEVRRAAVDRDPMVAFEAGQTLRALLSRGTETAHDDYLAFADGETPPRASPRELRTVALEMLLPYVERLGSLVSSASTPVARVAAASLGKIGDPRGAPYLAEGLRRDDVAADCAVALSTIGDSSCLDMLLELLESRDDRLVQHAVFAIGVFREAPVIAALEGLLSHPTATVRADAALVLGTVAGAQVAESIHPLLDDDDDRVVIKALEVLARVAPERFLEYFELRVATASDRLRATMVALLGYVEPSEDCYGKLERALEDSDGRVRANAVDVIASLRVSPERRMRMLAQVRSDHNNRVLANLAVALAPIDIVAALEILSSLLGSTNKWERASAVFAAGFIAEDKVAMWLANVFVLEEDPDVLGNAVTSLARCGGAEVVERMVQSLRHYNPRVRAGAARVLGMIARKGARRPLIREALFSALGRERDCSVLTALLLALPALADASHIRALGPLLRHSSPVVQARTIEVFEAIGTVEILPSVEPFIFSADSRVKAAATLVLWKQGHLDVIHVIGQMLEQRTDENEAEAASFAFGEIGLTLFRLHDYRHSYLLIAALSTRSQGRGCQRHGELGEDSSAETSLEEAFLGQVITVLPQCLAANEVEAVESLRALLAESPEDSYVHYLLGRLYWRLEQPERALAHYEVAAAALTGHVNLLLELAHVHHEMGAPAAALRWFMRAARGRAAIIERLSALSEKLFDEGSAQAASLTVKLIIEHFAAATDLHRSVGMHLFEVGQTKEAFVHLVHAAVADPLERGTWQTLTQVLQVLGRSQLAADLQAALTSAEKSNV